MVALNIELINEQELINIYRGYTFRPNGEYRWYNEGEGWED